MMKSMKSCKREIKSLMSTQAMVGILFFSPTLIRIYNLEHYFLPQSPSEHPSEHP